MKAIIFPGQGSQTKKEWLRISKLLNSKRFLRELTKLLKFNLSDLILNGSDEDLKKTEIYSTCYFNNKFCYI